MNVSILVPCYNEGEKIKKNIDNICNYMLKQDCEYEIIIINDGSKDNTFDYLMSIKKSSQYTNCSGIKVLTYKQNRGKGYAIKYGSKEAKYEYTIFMDADLSTDLSAIRNTLELFKNKNIDIVIGNRKATFSTVENKGVLRKIISFCCNLLTKIIVPINYQDTQCGFKGFKTEYFKQITSKQIIERFAFDVEYLYIAKLNNLNVVELPVKWKDDRDSRVSLFNSSVKFFKDLFKIRKNKNNYYF